jgi:hypothetical protein
MPHDEHVAMLGHGAAVWNEWRADHDDTPDLSRAGLRGLDLSGFDLMLRPPTPMPASSAKDRAKEAGLCFMGHALMENRNGLIVGAVTTRASGHAERLAAL